MKPIDLGCWEPSEILPGQMAYTGQRLAQEVFYELRCRLDSFGLLPDEYFELAPRWKPDRLIPKEADIYCLTDYGESEGIYVDVYLFWTEDGQRRDERFITGKTLGSSGKDMDRMYLIASAITKAFHGDQGSYNRYVSLCPSEREPNLILALNEKEQEALLDVLTEMWSRKLNKLDSTERIIRRMTGSISAYMDHMGRRPVHMDAFDRAMLAIRDGEYETFEEYWPHAKDHADDLLIEAAAYPGLTGKKMTEALLNGGLRFTADAYLSASVKAVRTGEKDRVMSLMDFAEDLVDNLPAAYYGDVLEHVGGIFGDMGVDLVARCTEEQIAAASPFTLYSAANDRNYRMVDALVRKGITTTGYAAQIISALYLSCGEWYPERLLKEGLKVSLTEYGALSTCIRHNDGKAAKILLDRGMDFSAFKAWVERTHTDVKNTALLEELEQYANTPKEA
ncbi:MAG: ankyrin repeat domain-containing protein [Oscillibacter sp.]|nr:ankyrin repeat domain-containing protein [Oscillibacter sp.]